MARLLFYADPAELWEMDVEGPPSESFVCMLGQGIHLDARAQLYSLITGVFLDEALAMEEPLDELSTKTSWISKLPDSLVSKLATFEEEDIVQVLEYWQQCEEVEGLGLDRDDLLEYLFALVSLCQAAADENACVYTYTTF
jgi:hypothetical protein